MIQPANNDKSQTHQIIPRPNTSLIPQTDRNEISQIARRVLQHSFAIQLADHSAFQSFGKGDVIVLLGTSTAGKSSIISSLHKIDPKRLEHGIDLTCDRLVLDMFKNHFSSEYAFLQAVLTPKKEVREIHDAIGSKLFHFKPDVSEQDQQKAMEIAGTIRDQMDKKLEFLTQDNVEGLMLDEVIGHSRCGKDSIFDILEIENVFRNIINRNFHSPMRIALVYCPFHLLTERMAERNRKAIEKNEFHEVRAGNFPLFQFAKLFGPKQADDDLVVETVTREAIENAFDINFDREVDFTRKFEPKQLEKRDLAKERVEGKNKLLKAFGFTDSNVLKVELTPKFKKYDYLIDTSQSKPEQTAKLLKH